LLSGNQKHPPPCGGKTVDGGSEKALFAITRIWSVAHEFVTSGRSLGSGVVSLGPSAWGCSSAWRSNAAGSTDSQTPSERSSLMAIPGAPSVRRDRTAAAVRSEAWNEAVGASDAAARVLARVRGPSTGVVRFPRATGSSRGSRIDDRQSRRHCCVEEGILAIPSRTGATSAMQGKRRRCARASHVCWRPTACSRQDRARAQLEKAAMGTLRSVGPACVFAPPIIA